MHGLTSALLPDSHGSVSIRCISGHSIFHPFGNGDLCGLYTGPGADVWRYEVASWARAKMIVTMARGTEEEQPSRSGRGEELIKTAYSLLRIIVTNVNVAPGFLWILLYCLGAPTGFSELLLPIRNTCQFFRVPALGSWSSFIQESWKWLEMYLSQGQGSLCPGLMDGGGV